MKKTQRTVGHKGLSHLDGVESCGFSLSHHGQMTSCHFGNTCPAPRAGQPLCCPELDSKVFQNKRAFYPSRTAGSTWSGCSPREEIRRAFCILHTD